MRVRCFPAAHTAPCMAPGHATPRGCWAVERACMQVRSRRSQAAGPPRAQAPARGATGGSPRSRASRPPGPTRRARRPASGASRPTRPPACSRASPRARCRPRPRSRSSGAARAPSRARRSAARPTARAWACAPSRRASSPRTIDMREFVGRWWCPHQRICDGLACPAHARACACHSGSGARSAPPVELSVRALLAGHSPRHMCSNRQAFSGFTALTSTHTCMPAGTAASGLSNTPLTVAGLACAPCDSFPHPSPSMPPGNPSLLMSSANMLRTACRRPLRLRWLPPPWQGKSGAAPCSACPPWGLRPTLSPLPLCSWALMHA